MSLTQPSVTLSSSSPTPESHEIPLSHIVPNPHQPRRQFEEPKLQELTDSIREHGVLSPILVRQTAPEQYELIAGERRWRAAQRAGLTTIPAIVRTFTEREQTEVALIENLQRDDLSPVEMARAFRTLMNEFGLSQKEVGERVHKSPSVISRVIRLLSLSDHILDGIERGDIQEKHARALLRVKNRALRDDISVRVMEGKLSAEATERLVDSLLHGETPREDTPGETHSAPVETAQVEGCASFVAERFEEEIGRLLVEKLATPVTIRHSEAEQGYIEIRFENNADLLRISDCLLTLDV